MPSAEALRAMPPQLVAEVTFYPVAEGGRKVPAQPAWAVLVRSRKRHRLSATTDGHCWKNRLQPVIADGSVLCSFPVRRPRMYFGKLESFICGKGAL
jgi:hypothetical protein